MLLRLIWGRPSMMISKRFALVMMVASGLACTYAYEAGKAYVARTHPVWVGPVEIVAQDPAWDLGNDFDRCLAAMDAAEIPGWMWECREFEPMPAPTPDSP